MAGRSALPTTFTQFRMAHASFRRALDLSRFDGTASIELLRSVAEFFMPLADADQVVSDRIQVTRKWRDFARRRVALIAEVNRMETAFEPRV